MYDLYLHSVHIGVPETITIAVRDLAVNPKRFIKSHSYVSDLSIKPVIKRGKHMVRLAVFAHTVWFCWDFETLGGACDAAKPIIEVIRLNNLKADTNQALQRIMDDSFSL